MRRFPSAIPSSPVRTSRVRTRLGFVPVLALAIAGATGSARAQCVAARGALPVVFECEMPPDQAASVIRTFLHTIEPSEIVYRERAIGVPPSATLFELHSGGGPRGEEYQTSVTLQNANGRSRLHVALQPMAGAVPAAPLLGEGARLGQSLRAAIVLTQLGASAMAREFALAANPGGNKRTGYSGLPIAPPARYMDDLNLAARLGPTADVRADLAAKQADLAVAAGPRTLQVSLVPTVNGQVAAGWEFSAQGLPGSPAIAFSGLQAVMPPGRYTLTGRDRSGAVSTHPVDVAGTGANPRVTIRMTLDSGPPPRPQVPPQR